MALRIVIIEDEPATARNLEFLLRQSDPGIDVAAMLPCVATSVTWFNAHAGQYDLVFMDIQLNDGLSFSIFDKVDITVPVIFVTAYNDYALQAFKTNGIDYILKPFDQADLQQALSKFKMLTGTASIVTDTKQIRQLANVLQTTPPAYRQSFLVHYRDKLVPLVVNDIAWLYTINEKVSVQTTDRQQYTIDFTMEQLQQQLDPKIFFRANRQFIIHRKAISEIEFYFNGRLLVKVQPQPTEQILISKARVPEFKTWMNV